MKNINKTTSKPQYSRWLDLRVVAVGGTSADGGPAGVFFVAAFSSSGIRSSRRGGRLSLFFSRLYPITLPLGKTQSKPTGVGSEGEGSGRK